MPQFEGKQAIARVLIYHRHNGICASKASITQLRYLVLSLNNFTFKGKHYLQVGGMAMDTKVAPSYANLFMSNFEYVYTYPDQPLLWVRLIDTILMIWTHGNSNLNDYIIHLNKCIPWINFTHVISPHKFHFCTLWSWIHMRVNSLQIFIVNLLMPTIIYTTTRLISFG